jgi:hypothetical protein
VSWEHIIAARDNPPPGLSMGARAVLLVVATYSNAAGVAYPSAVLVARVLDLHPGSVRRHMAELAAAGVEREPRHGIPSMWRLAGLCPQPRAERENTARRENENPAQQRARNKERSKGFKGAAVVDVDNPYAGWANWTTERLEGADQCPGQGRLEL